MKKRFYIVVTAFIAVLACLLLGACNPETDPTKCEHQNATFSVTKDATCTEKGTRAYSCPDCDKTWTEDIGALGHDYEEDAENSVKATCDHAGKTVRVCKNCGDKQEEPLKQLTHQYELSEEKSYPASCTEEGKTVKVCKLCGDEQSEPIKALGHSFQGYECTEQKCTNCEETRPATKQHNYIVKGEEHADDDESFDESVYCHGNLYTDYVCTICGDEYTTLSTEAQLHNVNEWTNDGKLTPKEGSNDCTYIGERNGECSNCSKHVTEQYEVKGHHTYVTRITEEATCAHEGKKTVICSVCQAVKEVKSYTDSDAHDWDDGTIAGNVTTYKCKNDASHTKTAIVAQAGESALGVTKTDIQNAKELVVKDASIEMSDDAKKGLPEGQLTLGVDVVNDDNNLDVDQSLKEQLSGKDVYNITLATATENVTQFKGKITVRIPYTLAPDEDVESIVIWYVKGSEVVNIKADYSNGYVVFETEHFSYYTVGKLTPAQICERYGHNIVNESREATCELGGFELSICSRCGEVKNNVTTAALGHDLKESEQSTEAGCELYGKLIKKCSRCDYTTTQYLPPIGHKWEKDIERSHEANCESAGSDVFVCGNHCGKEYTNTVPQTGHQYEETVTPPSCLEGGFTTYRCKTCGNTYKGNFTEATGHKWNIEKPTCTEGQVCTVCGEEGAPATGHKYGEGDVCTECGEGCDHEWEEGEPVPSTCTEQGYTPFTCSKCHRVDKRELQPLADHQYGPDGNCTECGQPAPEVVSEYEKLIKSLASDKYTLAIKDVSFMLEESYDTYNYLTSVSIDELKLSLYITEDGKYMLYGKGDIDSDSNGYAMNISIDAVSDGENLYVHLTQNEDHQFVRIPMSFGFFGGATPVVDTIMSLFNNEELKAYVKDLITENSDLIADLINGVLGKVLVRTEVEGGYRYTFRNSLVRELNENLYTLTVDKLVDRYFGDGKFQQLSGGLRKLVSEKSVRDVADDILEMLKKYNIQKDDVFALIDGIAAKVTGDDSFSINDYYENEKFKQCTLAQLIEEAAEMPEGEFLKMFDSTMEMLKECTVYELLCSIINQNSEQAVDLTNEEQEEQEAALNLTKGVSPEFFHNLLNTIFGDNTFAFSFVTDSESAVKTIELGIDLELEIVSSRSLNISLQGKIELEIGKSVSAQVSEELKSVSEICEELTAKLRSTPDNKIVISEYKNEGYNTYLSESEEYITLSPEGKLQFVSTYMNGSLIGMNPSQDENKIELVYSVTKNISTIYDFEQALIVKMNDCGNWYGYEIVGNSLVQRIEGKLTRVYANGVDDDIVLISETLTPDTEEEYYDTNSGNFYYNLETKEVAESSRHKFELDKDRSQTSDQVDCEEKYVEIYVCEYCHQERKETHTKWHRESVRYELPEGSHSCLDGVKAIHYCTECGEDLLTEDELHKSEGHIYYWDEEKDYVTGTIQTKHGTLTYKYQQCVCGMEKRKFEMDKGGCYFDTVYHSEERNGHYFEYYRCTYEDCDYYMVEESWNDYDEDNCLRSEHSIYTFHDGEGNIIGDKDGYHMVSYRVDHSAQRTERVIENKTYTLEDNGFKGSYRKVEYTYECGHEKSYTYTEEYKYDQYDRPLSQLFRYDYGDQIGYSEYKWTYDGCVGTSYSRYSETEDWKISEMNKDAHAYQGEYFKATCTQYPYYKRTCKICHDVNYEIYDYQMPYGHSYYDGTCDRCGLQNAQSSDGVIVLEDLTSRDDVELNAYSGKIVVGVWDKYNLYNDTILQFSLVYRDAEDVERTVDVSVKYSIAYRVQADYYNHGQSFLIVITKEDLNNAISQATSEVESNWTFEGLRMTVIPAYDDNPQIISITLTDLDAYIKK